MRGDSGLCSSTNESTIRESKIRERKIREFGMNEEVRELREHCGPVTIYGSSEENGEKMLVDDLRR